jgi:hypothetical protein
MPIFIVFLIKMFVEAIRAMRKLRTVKPQPLCVDCSYAHVQYGTNGRRAISCTYGGVVRPVKLDVLYCTDYRNRNVQPHVVRIGFALEQQEAR